VATDYQIAALWISDRLSFLEQLCLVSFRDVGHHVKLYTYEPVEGVPEGIEIADANKVLSRDNFLTHGRTGSPALHSDLFRYKLLEKSERTIWADTDAYCVKRFETDNGHFYGWESDSVINGGVLGLPQDSEALGELLAFTSDEYAIPEWFDDEARAELEARKAAGNPVAAGEQPWGVWGPHALTHFLQKTGEAKYALAQDGLYPFSFRRRGKMLKPNFDISPFVTDNTRSIHFYGRRMRRRLVEREGGAPHPKCLIGRLLVKHGIDPRDSPLPPVPKAEAEDMPEKPIRRERKKAKRKDAPLEIITDRPSAAPVTAKMRAGRGQLNLTDLADKYGSDKGSSKHRYTELYNMLFQPYRRRKITFLEMGLQIGGPEHGESADRKTTDAPSVRMWLEYFSKAKIIGLDISDFSWFKDDRFTFVRCDMGERANIAKAAAVADSFNIIIDDAAHASHHQQQAFAELFPKLASGGLYIIEDLRWQPAEMETKGWPKTADLFQSYLMNEYFSHPDKGMENELNVLRIDFSGTFLFQAQFLRNKRNQVLVVHKR